MKQAEGRSEGKAAKRDNRRRMTLLFSMLDYLGIEKGRTRVEWVSAAEGQKFAETMNSFVETICSLGENKRLEDLRCKTE
jgi:coenzyme F420-reducing hydrogenase delta subunit